MWEIYIIHYTKYAEFNSTREYHIQYIPQNMHYSISSRKYIQHISWKRHDCFLSFVSFNLLCNQFRRFHVMLLHKITERERSSGWLPWSSLGTLKLAFNASNDDQGNHPEALFISVINNPAQVVDADDSKPSWWYCHKSHWHKDCPKPTIVHCYWTDSKMPFCPLIITLPNIIERDLTNCHALK